LGGDLNDRRDTGSRAWYLLLLVPVVGLLWVPIYATETPELFGFPFFYWYQFAWTPVSVAITWLVYVKTRTVRAAAVDRAPPHPPPTD
jgi:Protein of unknown function (DUF3311)